MGDLRTEIRMVTITAVEWATQKNLPTADFRSSSLDNGNVYFCSLLSTDTKGSAMIEKTSV
jgi:hypothetical protein